MKLNEIRKIYTDFFVSKRHTLVKSSSLVPENDPTLLFTNAGLNHFKDVFTGKEKRNYTRATSSQKCLRAGGKHNDLDNVGYTKRHHTFFEMLGNFSFGDYFKEEAITYAWEFLSKILKLPKEKLYFTVYPNDTEARSLWKKITNIDDSHILNVKDNIWSMGEIGPCGFDTEIFYDKGENFTGGLPGTKDEDGDRYIEIWNNVFMQYETLPNGEKIELKQKNIDTGMGLERIASVLQNVSDNFEIDLFKNLISYTEDILKIKQTSNNITSFKIITDHIRACSFMISDGIIPSNEGRGYVLRRIIRRALRYINMLGIKQPIFYKISDAVKNEMEDTYPELKEANTLIKNTIKTEEENFNTTLEMGLKILDSEISKTSGNILNGKTAFKLYDTYGFPIDLTADILRNKNMTIDMAEFQQEMQKQKDKSSLSSKFKGEAGNKQIFYNIKESIGITKFIGYNNLNCNAKIIALIENDTLQTEIKNKHTECFIVSDTTPFYAESGGQIADKGIIKYNNKVFKVLDVQKVLDNIYLHKIELAEDDQITINTNIFMEVDSIARQQIMVNHSAVHLLHKALKEIIGSHITQKGSWVGFTNFRFDFTSSKALTKEELKNIEILVNKYITDKLPITIKEMPINKAKTLGAVALFGEKYKDIVRVVDMDGVSIELCGGTHCSNTSEIEFFKIIKEESISAGIRRIEGITKDTAIQFAKNYLNNINKDPSILIQDLHIEMDKQEELNRQLQKQEQEKNKLIKEQEKNKLVSDSIKQIKKEIINNINFIYGIYENIEANYLKEIIDKLKQIENKESVIALFTINKNKISILIYTSKNITPNLSAINLVKEVSKILKGNGGGGKPDLAQAGGNDETKIPDAINYIINQIKILKE